MATQQSQQAAHFDAVANLQNNSPDFGLLDFTEASRREFRTFLDYLFDHDPISKIGIHILEIGAGTGRYTIPLAQSGYRVTAQDISNSSLEQIQRKAMQLYLDERIEIKCGVPVLLTKVPWNATQIEESNCGRIISENISSIIENIVYLMDKNSNQIFRDNAINYAKGFDYRSIFGELEL